MIWPHVVIRYPTWIQGPRTYTYCGGTARFSDGRCDRCGCLVDNTGMLCTRAVAIADEQDDLTGDSSQGPQGSG